MDDLDGYHDVQLDIEGTDGEFSLRARFPGIVPIAAGTELSRAEMLHENLSSSLRSRLYVFCSMLNLVAREGDLEHWQELDVCLTSLAMLLKEKGLDEAVDYLRPAIEGVGGVATGGYADN